MQAHILPPDTAPTDLVRVRRAVLEGLHPTPFVHLRAKQALANRPGAHARPLEGLLYARKDMLHRAGEPCEAGSAALRGCVSVRTAEVLTRLDEAGAIDLGALHMSELAFNASGHNPWLGDARNPWSVRHIAGGSSSGCGMATALRLVDAAVGSDTGGSVRLPAALCGVTGLKPSPSLLSLDGCVPLAPSLDTIGLLAPSAATCARMLQAACPDADLGRPDAPLPPNVRILVPWLTETSRVDAPVRDALQGMAHRLQHLGLDVRHLPAPDFAEVNALGLQVLGAEAWAAHGESLNRHPERFGHAVRERLLAGARVGPSQYQDALARRPALRSRFLDDFLPGQADLLLLPVLPCCAPTLDDVASGAIDARHGGLSWWCRPMNYLGLPALALPAGFDAAGLPIGLQLVGRPSADGLLLRVAQHYQLHDSWHRRRPPGALPEED